MAFNKIPTNPFPSYSSDGTNITIPIASLATLDAAKADAATGDSRAIILAFLETYNAHMNALPAADRSTKVKIRRTTAERSGNLQRSFVVTVALAGDLELVAE